MRLGLFRGRRWWPGSRAVRSGGHDAGVAAPRPRGGPGHHRKPRRRSAIADAGALAVSPTAAKPQQSVAGLEATGHSAPPAGPAGPGTRLSGPGGSGAGGPGAGLSGSGGSGAGGPGAGLSGSGGSGAGSPAASAVQYAQPPGAAVARAAIKTAPGDTALAASRPARATHQAVDQAGQGNAWYEAKRAGRATAATVRHCGPLESVLVREWSAGQQPLPESVTAITRLAQLPQLVKEKLAAGLDAIHVGAGGVPDLDSMARLKGVLLPSGRATWDACAGAYGDRKIIVGTKPSPTPDVMCHEVGHALDDIDGTGDRWQSDSDEFQDLYSRCVPHLASEFHQHGGALGRREFFADAFAAIASSQRPALVEMLGGNTRAALNVMLYFNVRYGM